MKKGTRWLPRLFSFLPLKFFFYFTLLLNIGYTTVLVVIAGMVSLIPSGHQEERKRETFKTNFKIPYFFLFLFFLFDYTEVKSVNRDFKLFKPRAEQSPKAAGHKRPLSYTTCPCPTNPFVSFGTKEKRTTADDLISFHFLLLTCKVHLLCCSLLWYREEINMSLSLFTLLYSTHSHTRVQPAPATAVRRSRRRPLASSWM